ncbi:MAG: CHAT domain-containing tetratricopeptide repeat protein [Anaerolineae bacterium]
MVVYIPDEYESECDEILTYIDKAQKDPALYGELVELLLALLPRVQKDHYPEFWATLWHHLGYSYYETLTGDRANNVREAMHCFEQALDVFTPEAYPENYATAETTLGLIYSGLVSEDRSQNLLQAFACYERAATVCSPTLFPAVYASVRLNMGTAYKALLTGDLADNQSHAIACFEEALSIYRAVQSATDSGTCLRSLASVYCHSTVGDQTANFHRAIEYLEECLRICDGGSDPISYARTLAGLAEVYCFLPYGDHVANVKRGIAFYEDALGYISRSSSPHDYACTNANLGNAYYMLIDDNRASNLSKAFDHYTEAAKIISLPYNHVEYAAIEYNLALLCAEWPRGDSRANDAEAWRCYQNALALLSPDVDPSAFRNVTSRVGELYFSHAQWDDAHAAFDDAIKVSERLYQAAVTYESRQSQLASEIHLYTNDAYCLARLGRLADAVERIEAGRTRALVEGMARGSAVLGCATKEDKQAFEQTAAKIKALDGQVHALFMAPLWFSSVGDFSSQSSELKSARADLDVIVGRIRSYFPDFLKTGCSLSAVANALDRDQAVVYLATTSAGSMAILVPRGSETLSEKHIVWLPRFTTTDLDSVIEDLSEYYGLRKVESSVEPDSKQRFMDRLRVILPLLGERLLIKVVGRLLDLGFHRCVLVPCGRLAILPLHASEVLDGCYIDQVIEVFFGPSSRVLLQARQRAKLRSTSLLAVADPSHHETVKVDDLELRLPLPRLQAAQIEVEDIATVFPDGRTTVLGTGHASRDAVLVAMTDVSHLHFACHGRFEVDQPLSSGLALVGSDWLTARDILSRADLSGVQLVVLSACQTSIVDHRHVPDEYVGLPAVLLQAGASGIISALWPVDDVASALLFTHFYIWHLQEGLAPAAALRRSQQWLRDSTAAELGLAGLYERLYKKKGAASALRKIKYHQTYPDVKPFAHPYYWAAFTFTGVST